ncbi:MAG: cobalamin-binding protein [Cyanobacteriota bacterium]|nr:cobalamin-binding protein [Cyanobacteriota bacterium]
MTNSQYRIVSLIPSATEILASLGLMDAIVGRSHECDYPQNVHSLPVCTQPKFEPDGSSGQIHERVAEVLQSALSVYRVEIETLEELQPTHIITQAQCEVCACSLADVEAAVTQLVGSKPQVISLQPNKLEEVWRDIEGVAAVFEVDSEPLLTNLNSRLRAIQEKTAGVREISRPTVACIEWTEPLMAAGNWIPELVNLAGGEALFGVDGQHSPWLKWEKLLDANPEVIIFMPCGFDLEKTRRDALEFAENPDWKSLQAVKNGRVYITDGNAYFNRPGPRLVDSLEILAEILHPELFAFDYRGVAWKCF